MLQATSAFDAVLQVCGTLALQLAFISESPAKLLEVLQSLASNKSHIS